VESYEVLDLARNRIRLKDNLRYSIFDAIYTSTSTILLFRNQSNAVDVQGVLKSTSTL